MDVNKSPDSNYEATENTNRIINYLLIPSLERMALIEIVIALWREVDRRAFRRWRRTMDFAHRDCSDDTVMEMKEKVNLLCLPKSIELKILNLIKPVGEHIWEWRMDCYYKDYDVNSIQSIDILQWTYRGTIDRSKTMATLIAKHRIVHKLYAKACHHCIEHQIYKLWDQLLEYEKDMYSKKVIEDGCDSSLELYWTCVIRNDLGRLSSILKNIEDNSINTDGSIHEIMIMLSISYGNASAVRYFWYKLTEEEKAKNLTFWVTFAFRSTVRKNVTLIKQYTEITCFLMSHMDWEQQKLVFKEHGKSLLEMLITNWPAQDFLVPTISLMWDFIDINVYAYLVSVIVRCIHGEFKSEVRIVEEAHLRQLWRATPKTIKKDFFQCVAGSVNHLNDIFKGKKFETSWILLAEFLFGRDVEPDTLRDCQFIYTSLNRRMSSECHALRF
ncbi:uncharacterized protein [Parasteatoda tepidariorum]|uniref:uncharacterized protein n=1 Tax=Parasteatoda tepidariorum TaxID=114398 RepID=UPI0039BC63DB